MIAPAPRVADLVDVLVVAVVVYGLLRGLRRGKGGLAFLGVIIFTLLFLAASTLGLRLVSVLFQGFFTVLLVALVVIFQEEIRQFFERLAVWSLRRRGAADPEAGAPAEATTLANAAFDLAERRVGALIAVQGKMPLAAYAHGGIPLDARISVPLLQSIFDPNSPGHDGAMLVTGDRAARFGCHLELSTNEEEIGGRGTRHAAALGLSERTDALCLVVSEERGTVSVARGGRLERVDKAADLANSLQLHLRPRAGRADGIWRGLLFRHAPQKIAAIAIAALLWFFFVHEAVVDYRAFDIPVRHAGLRPDLEVALIDPPRVEVITSAPRRTYYFVTPDDFELTLELFQAQPGVREVFLTASDLTYPAGVTFVNVVPRNIRVEIRAREASASPR